MHQYLITHQGKMYIFKKNDEEHDEMFIDRCWFIVRNIKKRDLKQLTCLSHIWVNHKYLNVTYTPEIMDLILT